MMACSAAARLRSTSSGSRPRSLAHAYEPARLARGSGWRNCSAPGPIDPGGDQPSDDDEKKLPLDESAQGAAPYNLLGEPEPVLAADLDLNGLITRKNFLKLADMHFQTLDTGGRGYLTLATLPKTQVQKLLESSRPKKRRS